MSKVFFPHAPSVPLALIVDLEALKHNYRTLCSQMKRGAHGGCVLKANAYGMGMKAVAPLLYNEGCRHFFVAHITEAIELKKYVGQDATIYVLNGLRRGDEEIYAHYNIIPVLSDPEQVYLWNSFGERKQNHFKAALHFDTGMMRTGLGASAVKSLGLLQISHMEIVCIMSHLACPYQPHHPMNEAQRQAFEDLRSRFNFAPASLSNSGGLCLGPEYHYDILRFGLGLTGSRTAVPKGDYKLKPVLKAYAQILHINDLPRGEALGYDATFIAPRPSRIATLGVGYADGIMRSLSNKGEVYLEGRKLPIVGRISMDLMTVDVTDVPFNMLQPGDWVELFGDNLPIESVSEKAETISWELFTRLGPRFERFYLNDIAVEKAV